MLNRKFNYNKIINGLLVFFIVLILIFYLAKLFVSSIFLWDEASYALSSVEMAKTNDFLVPTIQGEPSTYNTKPTLVLILQALCIKMFGINEFAIRLPTALFVIALIFLIYYYVVKFTKNIQLALLSILVFFCSVGFFSVHIAFSGDLDCIFSFFSTWFCFYYFDSFHFKKEPLNKNFAILVALIILTFLSKSIAGLLLIPGLFVFTIFTKRNLFISKGKQILISGFSFVFFVMIYFLITEKYNPGNFNRFIESDFKRYAVNVMPWHNHGPLYYTNNLIYKRYFPFVYFFPLALWVLYKTGKPKNKLHIFSLIISVVYIVVISIPIVKLEWYDAPVYPFLSIFIAFGILELKNMYFFQHDRKFINGIFDCFGVLFLSYAMYNQITNFSNIKNVDEFEKPGVLFKDVTKGKRNSKLSILMKVEHKEYYDHVNFYREKREAESNIQSKIINSISQTSIGDTIITSQQEFIDSIYLLNYKEIHSSNNGKMFIKY